MPHSSFQVDALAAGEQILILRKGGIHERAFSPPSSEFLFFPGFFHATPEMLKPDFLKKYSKVRISDCITLIHIPRYDEQTLHQNLGPCTNTKSVRTNNRSGCNMPPHTSLLRFESCQLDCLEIIMQCHSFRSRAMDSFDADIAERELRSFSNFVWRSLVLHCQRMREEEGSPSAGPLVC
jgi:hypothetical protein